MNVNIHDAAKRLQREIPAPAGAVSTIAQSQQSPPSIRVLIDPLYWSSCSNVPEEFEGYHVVVERREFSALSLQR